MASSLNVAWPEPAFDPEAITVLAAAFDEAWDRLRQSGSEGARQNDLEFREVTRPRLDLYRPAMLLDDDVVTDGKTEPSSFPSRLGRKERVEQLFLNLRRNTGAVIAYPDFDLVTKVLGRRSQRRLVVASMSLRFALRCRIEAIGDQVEQ